MVVTLGQQYNTGEKHTVVMLLVIGKEKTFTLYNESTEIFYDVYSETVVHGITLLLYVTVGVSGTNPKKYFTQSPIQLSRVQYNTVVHCNDVIEHYCNQ